MDIVETNMKELEDNLSTYNGTMDTFYTQALTKIETIKGLITTIKADIEQYQRIQKEYNYSQMRVASLQNEIEGLSADMERLREANRKLREEQNADQQLRQQLEALQKELRELRNEQSSLQEQLGIATADNEEKDKQIQAYSRDIESKEDEIAQKQRELDENAGNIEIMREQLEIMREALERERKRESGLGGQLEAYGDRIVQLNTLLQQLSGDPRAEQVQKGLDEIIDQLNGLTNNSGDGGPGPPPAPFVNPASRSYRASDQGTNSGSTPDSESVSRPGTADSQSSEIQRGDNTSEESAAHLNMDGTADDVKEEQKRETLPQGQKLPPITRSAHKVLGVNKKTNEDISIDFPPDVHGADMDARRRKMEQIVDKVYNEMKFTDDQKVKNGDKVDYPHTIRMAASVGSMSTKEKQEMRKNVRKELMEWQNDYTRDGKTPFKDFYLSTNNYSHTDGKHDPFNVEFPYYISKNYIIPMNRASSKGGKTKRKKTRKNKGGKSKNKTIRYKRGKNRKQSKK
jgi:predicted  nucleic acid-binding Zn-ribbon protein